MKAGGNSKCNQYLQQKGIGPRTPIKQKYESPAAQLYKQVLKARVEGRPEPTQLPPPAPPKHNNGSAAPGADVNGMERLAGETDQQYIARQTRLREEAKARMAAKFGGGGGMGGVGSSGGGSRMQGIGSDPHYNRNNAGGGGAADIMSGLGSFASSAGSFASSMARSLGDEQTVQSLKTSGASFWGGLTQSVQSVASNIAAPDTSDGLADLQRQVASQKPGTSKYAGFGSDRAAAFGQQQQQHSFGSSVSATSSQAPSSSGGGLQEAPGLPGEDRNGVERLSGESDEQYVLRQTRLRDEARARMSAKFGGGGMTSTSSSSGSRPTASAPSSGNHPNFGPTATHSAPSSGNAPNLSSAGSFPRSTTPPAKQISSTDFFSSFGT